MGDSSGIESNKNSSDSEINSYDNISEEDNDFIEKNDDWETVISGKIIIRSI